MPAHALFVNYRTAAGRYLEPEIFPRAEGEVYVCGMADPTPLPDSQEAVEVSEDSCAASSVDLHPFDPARLPSEG